GGLNNLLSKIPGLDWRIPLIPVPDIPYFRVGRATASGAAGMAALAGGGRVPGRFIGPTADNVLAWLTPREEVIRVAAAERMRRLFPGALEHINAHGTLPGFAAGGSVGSKTGGILQDIGNAITGGAKF